MAELDRVRWQCRRGMLELDLILARFLETYYSGLTAGQRTAFKSLLEWSDNDLWDLISGQAQPAPGELAGVVSMLRRV